jgi:hypothetical protein
MRFINLTRKIARWTCSSVRGSNEPSKPIRIKKIHSHLIIVDIGLLWSFDLPLQISKRLFKLLAFSIWWLSFMMTSSTEDYLKKTASCSLNLISMLLLLSVGQYAVWLIWPRYSVLLWFIRCIYHWKPRSDPLAWVTLANFGFLLRPFDLLLPKTFKLFGLAICWLWACLMSIILGRRRAN